jgi:hypothetical protein
MESFKCQAAGSDYLFLLQGAGFLTTLMECTSQPHYYQPYPRAGSYLIEARCIA